MQNKKERYESIYFVSTKYKNPIKEQLGCRYFFLNAAALSRIVIVKAMFLIGTQYRHLLNIKGLGSGSG